MQYVYETILVMLLRKEVIYKICTSVTDGTVSHGWMDGVMAINVELPCPSPAVARRSLGREAWP